MTQPISFGLAFAFAFFSLFLQVEKVSAASPKVVSFNLCADQLALEFGNFNQVLGVSNLSRDPDLSYHWRLAVSVPAVRASAELALRIMPDLVLFGQYDGSYTKAILANAGMKIYSIPVWHSLAETKAGVVDVATKMGQRSRGEELVSDIDRSLHQLKELRYAAEKSPSFLILQRRGYAQRQSLAAEVLNYAGMRDASKELDLPAAGGFVPLEKLIKARPDYLVISEAITLAEDQGQALLLHPAVTALYPLKRRLVIPDVLSFCGGPSTPALINQARREIEAKVILK